MLNDPDSSATGVEAATMIADTISHQVSCYSWLYMFSFFWGGRVGFSLVLVYSLNSICVKVIINYTYAPS